MSHRLALIGVGFNAGVILLGDARTTRLIGVASLLLCLAIAAVTSPNNRL
ncbi:hypothetical protein ACFO0M_10230 [Micromonospora mangrovi]|uniref:Uncharacterized protein n=2 Tax=Micromonospora TaxID=1873 RepID=A0AAU8HDR7_9ACTN